MKGGYKNMKKENNAIIVTSIIAGVVLLIAILALTTFNNVVPNPKDTVTVEGVATIDAQPDLISVHYTIEGKGDTSSLAKDEADKIYDALIVELAKAGFDRSELTTQGFNVYPNVYWEDGKQKEDGYKASHSLKLELPSENFDRVSQAIDAGVNADAGISFINFELSPELQSQKKAEALELASKDAKLKAEAVASGFGKDIGNLVSVQVSDFGYYPWSIYSSRGDGLSIAEDASLAKEAVESIVPSDQSVTGRVSATYKIR